MSLKISTHIPIRRPTLVRDWRANGTRLTSNWLATAPSNTDTMTEGGPRP